MDEMARAAAPYPAVVQTERLGTAHAALQAVDLFGDGDVAVLYADNPLIRPDTLRGLLARRRAGDAGLVLMGGLLAARRTPAPEDGGHAARTPDWRGVAAITAAVALFIGLANTAGLAPATFACVLAGALGTRGTTPREAMLLAAGVTVFGVLLFSYGLKVQFPVLRGVLP